MKIEAKQVNRVKGAIALLIIFIIISLWLMFEYLGNERQRDLNNWQSRLALLSEVRTAAVEDHIKQEKSEIEELAANPTLRLFLTQYSKNDDTDNVVLRAQQGHVRNLISSTAQRFDLANESGLNTNINKASDFGLAVLDEKQQLVLSTRGFPVLQQGLTEKFKQSQRASSVVINLYKGSNGHAVYGYIAPILHIQSATENRIVGYVLLLLNPQNTLFKILQNRQSITTTDETLLVRREGQGIIYMSPLEDGYELFHIMPDDNALAASFAYHSEGGFALLSDYKGENVLVTGRKVAATDWTIVQKINANEALAESDQHQQFLLTIFSILVLFIAAAFIAIWRHSTSIRLQKISHQLETHSALLDAVTDNIQDHIMLVEKDDLVCFMNPIFMAALDLQDNECVKARVHTLLGSKTAEMLAAIPVGQQGVTRCIEINGVEKSYHVTVTQPVLGEYQSSRLYVLHDISEIKKAQNKREQLAKGIITTLVKAADLHDPYCANHSERTREVALEIAGELSLAQESCESLEMAALLANIGKLFVAKEILTKMEPLTEAESAELRKHIDYALEILSDLSFNGPVIDIIAQKNERCDGSGYPKGLSGEDILLESRILAVANAFVAMASSRAYREGRPIREVVDVLLSQADQLYDRQVVAALFHISENRHDWEKWQQIET